MAAGSRLARLAHLVRMAGLVLMLGWAGLPAQAHEVHDVLSQAQATVLTLRYADGEAFAGETYQLFAGEASQPSQTGRTDAKGRVVFLADPPGRWRLRAFSDDGHGLDTRFDAGGAAVALTPAAAAAPEAGGPNRSSRLVFGLGLVLALFGALQLFVSCRRRRPA